MAKSKTKAPGAAAGQTATDPANKPLINWVVVLGDYGRSPRMQYHTQSLANKPNSVVYVIAYGGAAPLQSLTDAPNVHIATLPEVPTVIQKLPGIASLAFKVLHQLFMLLWAMLFKLPAPCNILMQNPPAIPTMVLCWVAAMRHGASLVIDWHNFGYTIMALKHKPSSLLVRTARSHEVAWGRRAQKHFCVTRAMQEELKRAWHIPATVLYDRPPTQFQRTDVTVVHDLLDRLAPAIAGDSCQDFAALEASTWGPSRTIATELTHHAGSKDEPAWRSDRPAILISSTSWTPDEDFGILLEALVLYEETMTAEQQAATAGSTPAGQSLPPLLVVITGRGPQRDMYLRRVAQLHMKHVAVRSVWLEMADYPLLLGAADLGVSLHASSSGLDLPMKVVDMFGSGLPVCALAYSCINELVEDGQTGLLFSTPAQLCEQLQSLLKGFPARPSQQLLHMQQQVAEKEQGLRWDANWDAVAWPLLQQK